VLAARRRTGITWEGQPIDRLMRLFHSPRPLSATNLTRRSVALNGFVDSRDEGEGGEEADHAEHGEGSEAHQPHIPTESIFRSEEDSSATLSGRLKNPCPAASPIACWRKIFQNTSCWSQDPVLGSSRLRCLTSPIFIFS